jgi:hypothetical protein
MKPLHLQRLIDSEGKGMVGCLTALVLLGVAIYLGITLGPIYYSNYNFESDIKTEVSRAGSHFYDDETVIKDVIDLGKKNEIRLDRQNIRIDRFAGQMHINVNYSVPVDFIVMQKDVDFKVRVSSFVGSL